MSTHSDVNTLMTAASDALAAGNYSSAEELGVRAQGILSVLPIDVRKEGHASGSLRFSEAMIDNFLANVRRLVGRINRSSGLGITSARVKFASGRCGGNC
jgi:hypothetical protein